MTDLVTGQEYVAMGSSFAAGIGLRPRDPESPRRAGRSQANYAHLVARQLNLNLRDVTFSGATARQILNGASGRPSQLDALAPSTRLVTLTCGGNDVNYIGRLALASLPLPLRVLPPIRRRLDGLAERSEDAFVELPKTFDRLLDAVRVRAPRATVVLVDYLTLLPADPDVPTPPLSAETADWTRQTARRLAAVTAAAASRNDCILVPASEASIEHHAWAAEPWTSRFQLRVGNGAPYHPTPAGMQAVADLLINELRERELHRA